ncbi:MAG: Rpn family recombination-promoting nuclease/putative transposase [Myxococcota bacterium]
MARNDSDTDDVVNQPHDALVRRMLTRPETAAVELDAALPATLTAHLDWSTLHVKPGTYINPKLRRRHSDILYSVALRDDPEREILIYVLMEHQSSPKRLMAWRLLVYVCRIWEQYVSNNKKTKTLPMIVPMVLFHGPNGWTMPQRLSELLDVPPELAANFPSPIELVFAVDDMDRSVLDGQIPADQRELDRAVALAEAVRTLLWLASHASAIDAPRAEALGPLFEVIRDAWGPDDLQALLTYIVSAFKRDSPLPDILFRSASKETRLMFTTIRDQLITEGEARGETKGEARGLAHALERLLNSRGLKLDKALRTRITDCKDPALLQRWFDRALKATTLTEVFDD